jgi:hypothetical protein
MRHATFSRIRFATLLWVLIDPACFDLPKVDVGARVIDDFAGDAGISAPTWAAFGPWRCSPIVAPNPDGDGGGSDGGPALDGGQPPVQDGDQPGTCTIGPGAGDGVDYTHALAATFNLAAPIGRLGSGVMVATFTSGHAVDLTGFKTLRFNSRLYSTTPPANVVPPGTIVGVELGCVMSTGDFVADRKNAGITVEAPWGDPIKLNLAADFSLKPASGNITNCLQTVDVIRFIVTLPTGTEPIRGTLLLEGIEVTTY